MGKITICRSMRVFGVLTRFYLFLVLFNSCQVEMDESENSIIHELVSVYPQLKNYKWEVDKIQKIGGSDIQVYLKSYKGDTTIYAGVLKAPSNDSLFYHQDVYYSLFPFYKRFEVNDTTHRIYFFEQDTLYHYYYLGDTYNDYSDLTFIKGIENYFNIGEELDSVEIEYLKSKSLYENWLKLNSQ